MANQDSGSIQALGSALADVTAYQKQTISVSISLAGSGDMDISGKTTGFTFTKMSGSGDMNVSVNILQKAESISMSGTLSSDISTQNLVNAYTVMYGFLTSSVETSSSVFCVDLPIDFNTQTIESFGCKIKGNSVELKRYRGDTYPVNSTLSKNGNKNTTGITFQMSTQIADGTIYTVDGTITDAVNGIVDFPLTTAAVATAGVGVYDIEGNDGTYIYTYEKGVFTLLDDVTV